MPDEKSNEYDFTDLEVANPKSEKDDLIGICGECGTEQRDERVRRWYEAGVAGVCGTCGGVVIYAWRSSAEGALRQFNRQRGLGDDTPRS